MTYPAEYQSRPARSVTTRRPPVADPGTIVDGIHRPPHDPLVAAIVEALARAIGVTG